MNDSSIHSYRDLIVWQRAMDLGEATYRATEHFPSTERYGLVSQMRRAAVSVASNIAEGHTRTIGDYIRFLSISAGSLSELETQLILSERLGFVAAVQVKPLADRCDELSRMLSVLRKRLRAKRAPKSPSP